MPANQRRFFLRAVVEDAFFVVFEAFTAPRLTLLLLAAATAHAQQPKNGAELLERMRAAYEGKWYHSLTFVQKTTQTRPDGSTNVSTWYESLRHTSASGVQLRIAASAPQPG